MLAAHLYADIAQLLHVLFTYTMISPGVLSTCTTSVTHTHHSDLSVTIIISDKKNAMFLFILLSEKV